MTHCWNIWKLAPAQVPYVCFYATDSISTDVGNGGVIVWSNSFVIALIFISAEYSDVFVFKWEISWPVCALRSPLTSPSTACQTTLYTGNDEKEMRWDKEDKQNKEDREDSEDKQDKEDKDERLVNSSS